VGISPMRIHSILESIGNTPHVKLRKLFGSKHSVWMKLERSNPAGSIKDRIALSMVEDAESRGILKPDGVIIEPTSGNTGVALAMIAAAKGYKAIIVMPESMSVERRTLIKGFGATLVLTPRELGMKGAIEKALELATSTPNAWIPQQFENPANPRVHEETTANEIRADFPEGIDYLITGIGTGGHITGCARVLKEYMPNLIVVGVEPAASPVLSGGDPSPHPIQGIGAGFIPTNCNTALIDSFITVTNEDAFHYAQQAMQKEGLCIGISSGASLAAVAKALPTIPEGSTVLTFCYDTGERYVSNTNLFPSDQA
jgi:cysteine synthase A